MIWCETSKPDLEQAKKFAEAIHAKFPGKLLSYNCSPSFNWRANLDEATLMEFRESLAILEAALGSQDPTVRRARNDLANVERVLAEIRAGGETSLPAAPQP